MDVMPDCAPAILGLVTGDDDEKWKSPKRHWNAERDFGENAEQREKALAERRTLLQTNDGQSVRTFVADHWTLEYDLAFCGLAEDVYVAAILAKNDGAINEEKKGFTEIETTARTEFKKMEEAAAGDRAALSSQIYRIFHARRASKAIAAQHLAELLARAGERDDFDKKVFATKLPPYVVDAIAHVAPTDVALAPASPPGQGEGEGDGDA